MRYGKEQWSTLLGVKKRTRKMDEKRKLYQILNIKIMVKEEKFTYSHENLKVIGYTYILEMDQGLKKSQAKTMYKNGF